MPDETQMPKYRCHKEVWALKIRDALLPTPMNGSGRLVPENKVFEPIEVDAEYMQKHKPMPGGYYVVYEDGYKSFSPAAAFESGYTRIIE